jgi:hypothetical protein
MQDVRWPSFVYAGTSKAASTWIYDCFRDHPEVAVHPATDSLNFFDVNYDRGPEWYEAQFDGTEGVRGETTPSYMYDPHAASRIAEVAPETTLLFCLRNPVDRAFSQWWHGYSEGYWSYEFEAILDVYPAYQMWAVPGFYAHHLDRFDTHFSAENLEIMLFDDLVADDRAFVADLFARVGVDDSYVPTPVDEKSNEAHTVAPGPYETLKSLIECRAPTPVKRGIRPFYERIRPLFESRDRYEEGMDEAVRERLERLFAPDVRRLSDRLGRDLSDWFEHVDPDAVGEQPPGPPNRPSA